MIKAALEYLLGLAKPPTVTVGDLTYSTMPLTPILPSEFPSVGFHTLSGLVDFLAYGPDAPFGDPDDKPQYMLHVINPTVVQALGPHQYPTGRRSSFAVCKPADQTEHRFGSYMDQETFSIYLQSRFVDSDDRADVLKLTGTLQHEAVQTLTDDGTTQRTAAKTGIAKVQDVVVKSPVVLRPYRTFPEVEQPASRFILRLRGGGETPIALALHEVADGAWKLEAMANVAVKLRELLVVAFGDDAPKPPVIF